MGSAINDDIADWPERGDPDCECCLGDGLQADGETPCPCTERSRRSAAMDSLIAENQRLTEELRQTLTRLEELRTGGESQRAAFDYRLVLENPDFGWPADMMEQARDLRDAARTAQLRPCHATRRHGSQHVRILTPDMTARFFDNRDPRDWTDPVQICATEWVS